MENAASQQPMPDPKPANKWLRLGRKILIGAVIMYCVNLFLNLTGWDSWETFSKRADHFAENFMSGASRLSPIGLWKSITQSEGSNEYSPAHYLPEYENTKDLTIKDKILNWLGDYWYTESGKAFWIGRILLVLAILGGLAMAAEDYGNAKNKNTATLIFPFNAAWKSIIFLLGVSVVCIVIYFIIKLFLAIGAGIVALFSAVHAIGGILALIFDEMKNAAADSSKKNSGHLCFAVLI